MRNLFVWEAESHTRVERRIYFSAHRVKGLTPTAIMGVANHRVAPERCVLVTLVLFEVFGSQFQIGVASSCRQMTGGAYLREQLGAGPQLAGASRLVTRKPRDLRKLTVDARFVGRSAHRRAP